jgi:cell division protein FtsB
MKIVTFHMRRWQVVAAFLALAASFVVVAVLLTGSIRDNSHALRELKQHSASIHQLKRTNRRLERTSHRLQETNRHLEKTSRHLEQTNCGLRAFLLSSAKFRERAATKDTDPAMRAQDIQGAKVSLQLANKFANELCRKSPKK